jgi:hypothetical protein
MSERTVLDHFLTVGSSRSKALTYVAGDYAPIARFGIGFWSVFTIADRARIETQPFESAHVGPGDPGRCSGFAFEVTLDDLKDYTVFEENHAPIGTSVTLFLKPEVVLDEVVERARGHLLASLVPITWVLDGDETLLSEAVPEVTPAQLLGVRWPSLEASGVRVFPWREAFEGIDLALALAYRLKGGLPTFMSDEQQPLLNFMGGIHFPRTAVCGFSVSARHARTCFALERVGLAVANHHSPRGFAFSLDRQALVENDAQKAFARKITAGIHSAYRAFLCANGAYNPKAIFLLNEESELRWCLQIQIVSSPNL